jgi:hypothetical protein
MFIVTGRNWTNKKMNINNPFHSCTGGTVRNMFTTPERYWINKMHNSRITKKNKYVTYGCLPNVLQDV